VAAGESEHAALVRELREELGIEVTPAGRSCASLTPTPIATSSCRCGSSNASAARRAHSIASKLKWVAPRQLAQQDLLEADRPFIEALRDLPAPG